MKLKPLAGSRIQARTFGATPPGRNWRARKHPLLSKFLSVLLLLIALREVRANDLGGVIRGEIVDDTGANLQEAIVSVVSGALRDGSLQAKSNKKGVFAFADLPPGNYVLLVSKPGFGAVRMTDISLLPQNNVFVTITLTPRLYLDADEQRVTYSPTVSRDRFGVIRSYSDQASKRTRHLSMVNRFWDGVGWWKLSDTRLWSYGSRTNHFTEILDGLRLTLPLNQDAHDFITDLPIAEAVIHHLTPGNLSTRAGLGSALQIVPLDGKGDRLFFGDAVITGLVSESGMYQRKEFAQAYQYFASKNRDRYQWPDENKRTELGSASWLVGGESGRYAWVFSGRKILSTADYDAAFSGQHAKDAIGYWLSLSYQPAPRDEVTLRFGYDVAFSGAEDYYRFQGYNPLVQQKISSLLHVVWDHRFSGQKTGRIVVSHRKRAVLQGAKGGGAWGIKSPGEYELDNELWPDYPEYLHQSEWVTQLAGSLVNLRHLDTELELGGNVSYFSALLCEALISEPEAYQDSRFGGTNQALEVNGADWELEFYARDKWIANHKITLLFGLQWNTFSQLEPIGFPSLALGLNYLVLPRLTLTAAGGGYFRAPPYRALTEEAGNEYTRTTIGDRGNPQITAERVSFYETGLTVRPTTWASAEMTLFYKQFNHFVGVIATEDNEARFDDPGTGEILGANVRVDAHCGKWLRVGIEWLTSHGQGNLYTDDYLANPAKLPTMTGDPIEIAWFSDEDYKLSYLVEQAIIGGIDLQPANFAGVALHCRGMLVRAGRYTPVDLEESSILQGSVINTARSPLQGRLDAWLTVPLSIRGLMAFELEAGVINATNRFNHDEGVIMEHEYRQVPFRSALAAPRSYQVSLRVLI